MYSRDFYMKFKTEKIANCFLFYKHDKPWHKTVNLICLYVVARKINVANSVCHVVIQSLFQTEKWRAAK